MSANVSEPAHLWWIERLTNVAVFGGTLGVLGIAMWLTPEHAGHGTHQQLGLGECTFLTLTGAPCPMCGATTTFTMMAHLRLWDGVTNQPFAATLFLLMLGAGGIALSELLLPRNRWRRLYRGLRPMEGPLATVFLVLMALSWLYKWKVLGM